MKIQENISLKKFNSFGIDVQARYFSPFSSADELAELLAYAGSFNRSAGIPTLTLGGGSNILFTKNFDGLVLKNEVGGITLIKEDKHHVYVRAGAGEPWHGFVSHAIHRNWAGIENLSLIPGSVGAGPIQNIGAYGAELKEVFYELEAMRISDRKVYTFTLNDCEFGYRDSVFKGKYKDRYIILSVTCRMNKVPRFHTGYGPLAQELERMGVQDLSLQAVSQAVINIRSSKLPDPARIGNAGSFFKNPEIPEARFSALHEQFPGMPGFPAAAGQVKLAAGWLIEQCGWKGFRAGDAGVHASQALVLVNYGQASGQEIQDLGEKIRNSVRGKFGVELEREVNII
jgi:UDP-N-acetylmuramate dehydrogenase